MLLVKEAPIDLNCAMDSSSILFLVYTVVHGAVKGNCMLNKRDYGIDMLRFVACCAVVGLHTFTKGITLTSTVAYYACGFAVPIFFMCSGAFLLNRGG